jgi:selenocysteine lyase/cysteine desulfurase
VYALLATLEFMNSFGWPEIYSKVDSLAERATTLLKDHGFQVITPDRARGGIISIRHPASAGIVRALATESIHVEDRDSVIRASPHFYNNGEDIERFVSALARVTGNNTQAMADAHLQDSGG